MNREKSDYAPQECPECGEAAYIGMTSVECTNFRCRHFHEDTWEKHVLSLPDTGDPDQGISLTDELLSLDWEDEDTQPQKSGYPMRFVWGKDAKLHQVIKPPNPFKLYQKLMHDLDHAETGAAIRAISEEIDRTIEKINKAIDSTPSPVLYLGDNGSE